MNAARHSCRINSRIICRDFSIAATTGPRPPPTQRDTAPAFPSYGTRRWRGGRPQNHGVNVRRRGTLRQCELRRRSAKSWQSQVVRYRMRLIEPSRQRTACGRAEVNRDPVAAAEAPSDRRRVLRLIGSALDRRVRTENQLAMRPPSFPRPREDLGGLAFGTRPGSPGNASHCRDPKRHAKEIAQTVLCPGTILRGAVSPMRGRVQLRLTMMKRICRPCVTKPSKTPPTFSSSNGAGDRPGNVEVPTNVLPAMVPLTCEVLPS